jgi:aspartate/methionine/tyrosine aminotransferase
MHPPFSARTRWDRTPNRLAQALQARRRRGGPVFDLTESNPTRCGLGPRDAADLRALALEASLRYDPDPRGLKSAREAIASLYSERGAPLASNRIFLTAGTSEAYAWLFRLLADPGDEVLVPTPCYPLFDFLARINDVVLRPYPLLEEEGFRIDIDRLWSAAGPRARAILVVSPGNPTGAFLKRDEHESLRAFCEDRGMALIVDEVFGDYGVGVDPQRVATAAASPGPLTFVLDGLSKRLALPQLKLGWIAVSGPVEDLDEALARLEVIADTHLSVNSPVQVALPELLSLRPVIQSGVKRRLEANRRTLASTLAPPRPVHALPSEGGWSAVLRVPATQNDEEWALTLLEEDGVLVQPGYFYDFPGEGRLVVSLLPETEAFVEGIGRLAARIG